VAVGLREGPFSDVLSFLGVIVISLLSSIYPVLLLVSSRKKGEFVPGVVYGFFGHPVLLIAIYGLSLANLLLHGLVIWEEPLRRAGALFVGVAMVGVTVRMKRRGAFAPRTMVVLREDTQDPGRSGFAVTSAGRPGLATVQFEYTGSERRVRAAWGTVPDFSSLRRVIFHLPAGLARELKVWVHRVTATGDSEGVPGQMDVHLGGATRYSAQRVTDEPVIVPWDDTEGQVDIQLER
jgi:hypothetical protein